MVLLFQLCDSTPVLTEMKQFPWQSHALSSRHLFLGNPTDDLDGKTDVGSVNVYVREGTRISDTPFKKLIAPDGQTNDKFGFILTANNNYVVIVAPRNDGRGYIYAFDVNGFNMQEKFTDNDWIIITHRPYLH